MKTIPPVIANPAQYNAAKTLAPIAQIENHLDREITKVIP